MGSYIDNPFVCCSCFYPWGTIILQQRYIGQAVNFTPSKNIDVLSATIHQMLAVVLPFQRLLNLTSLV